MNRMRMAECAVICSCTWLLGSGFSSNATAQRPNDYEAARALMVEREVIGRGVRDPRVCAAMRDVPRHLFLPADQRKSAYLDGALPIGHGQTITSPYVVAFMTEKLEPRPTDRVLEIGTGSGYQAAVLSRLVAEVYTIEIVGPLGEQAARTIERLGYDNVHVQVGDGYLGWPEHAPFDKIIVTCSPEDVPKKLVEQLREGGRLVVPLGERFQQSLYLFRKVNGRLQEEKLESTFFVPMTGVAEELRAVKDDSGIPHPVNAGFEDAGTGADLPGWFYARQAQVVSDPTAPEGHRCLVLSNSTPGQSAHVLQAVGLDGRKLKRVTVSVYRRTKGIRSPAGQAGLPCLELTFYDEERASIRKLTLGPWDGDRSWTRESRAVAVPGRSRFAVILIGIPGATGELAVDGLRIVGTPH